MTHSANSRKNQAQSRRRTFPALCYGHIPLLKLWNEELRLKDKIAQVKKRMVLHFDVSAALFFVTAQQLIRPCPLQTPDLHKNCWLGDPARSVPSADLYDQAYTFLFTNGGSIFNWLRRQSVELTGDELTPIICYDQESACAVTIDGHGMAVGCDSFASCAGNCTKLCQQLYFMHLEERSSAPLVITGSNLDLPAHAELLRSARSCGSSAGLQLTAQLSKLTGITRGALTARLPPSIRH